MSFQKECSVLSKQEELLVLNGFLSNKPEVCLECEAVAYFLLVTVFCGQAWRKGMVRSPPEQRASIVFADSQV